MMLEESPPSVQVVTGPRPPLTRQKRLSKQNGLITKFLITQLDITTYKPSLVFKWVPKGNQESKDDADEAKIQQFCFPEANPVMDNLVKSGSEQIDNFSFILTNSLGVKSYAYCKRFIKQDPGPYCFVFISLKPHFSLFDEIFDLIESKYERNLKYSINALLNSLLLSPISGESTSIKLSANNSQTENYEVSYTPLSSQFQHITYETIYNMKPNHLVKLFESLLCESRIILCSSKLSNISNSILALHSLISPLIWQHIFISILPEPLMPYVSAPIPFLVGILDSSLKSFYQQPTEQVILYNVDKFEFMIEPAFKSLIPTHIINYLENSLKRLKNEHPTYDRSLDKQIRKPFYSVIYHLFQSFNQFMYKNGDSFVFNKDQFIEQAHSGQTKKLIETLVCSQMVEMFFNQKETEFTKVNDTTCPFLMDAKESCDKIATVSSKRQSQYDCPICMESTTSRPSLEFSGYTLHQDCFRCKMCSVGLREVEREKIILKKKDGERIQVYCADCRSNFFNKIKKSSSAKQFINLFKVDSDSNTTTGLSSFIGGINPMTQIPSGSASSPSKSSAAYQNNYPVFPVKSEIQNFKFQKKPPPKDLGLKSLSHGRILTPREMQSSTLPIPTTANSRAFDHDGGSKIIHSSHAGNLSTYKRSTPNSQQQQQNGGGRSNPPLPPTPFEKKERAFEQMKIKNIHIYSSDEQNYGTSFEEENSSASSTPSNTPPKIVYAHHINQESRAMQFSKALPEIPLAKQQAQIAPPTQVVVVPQIPQRENHVHFVNNSSSVGIEKKLSQERINLHNQLNNVNRMKRNQVQNSLPPLPPIPQGRPLPVPPIAQAKSLPNSSPTTTTSNSSQSRSPPQKPSPRSGSPSNQSSGTTTSTPPTPQLTVTIAATSSSQTTPNTNYLANKKPLPSPSPQHFIPIPPKPPQSHYNNNNNNNNNNNLNENVTLVSNKPSPIPIPKQTPSIPVPPPQPRPKPNNYPINNYYNSKSLYPNKHSQQQNNRQVSPREIIKTPSPENGVTPRRLNKQCFGCKEQLTCTTQLMVANGNYYHRDCFNCAQCNKQLQTGEYYFHSGMVYHFACANEILPNNNTNTNNNSNNNNYKPNKNARKSTNSLSLSS